MRTCATVAVLAILAAPVLAQAPPPPPPSGRSLPAQPAEAATTPSAIPARFEAADVRFTAPYRVPFYYGATIHDDRYILRQGTMVHLIATAYNLDQPAFVGGGPTWVSFDRYDIEAKIPPGTTIATARPMLQNLLAERFKLVVHRGDVPVPAYLLTVANGKPNLKPSASEEGSCKPEPNSNPAPGSVPPIVLECRGASMQMLASTLVNMRGGGYVAYNTPILDASGLKGAYDFDLKFTPSFFLPHSGSAGVSLFQALDQQLGLKLEAKTAPRPGIVIDSVNEEPTPNSPDLAKIMPPLPPPQFEVATVRSAQPGAQRRGRITGDELNFQGIPLKFLITWAWDLDPRNNDTLVAPKWLESDRIDIHAKVAAADLGTYSSGRSQIINYEDFRQMIRSLLIDRFQIKYHMEDRPIDAYTLVAVDPKLTRADPSGRTSCGTVPGNDGKDPRQTNIMLNSVQTCWNTTMDQFAGQLHRIAPDYFFYPVVDATGIKGAWDFTMSWSSADLTQGGGPGPKGGDTGTSPAPASGDMLTASEPNGAISFFDAIKKQLGLKIVKEKHPEPVLVIDQINEQPTEN
jgi:uncharacterized protein (TIGR03435 family)